ncbi:MAG: YjbH domain-containing protein, partial [Emcibacter sp.]|nr:YjbH domain-containing protein [Emcibacter sp.]
MMRRGTYGGNILLSLVMGCLPFFQSQLMADDNAYSFNNFGGIGLLDMRTARFAPDGTIAVGVHHNSRETRYFSTWQATPWLETTLSYTDDTADRLGIDRSLDVKLRLWTEGDYRPQLAIGVQDALGTGNFGAEYIVASKRYYDFDFT